MTTPRLAHQSGTFVSDGVSQIVNLGIRPDRFSVKNLSKWGSNATPGVMVQADMVTGQAAGSANVLKNTTGSAGVEGLAVTANGFTLIDYSNPQSYAVQSLTTPFNTAADPCVFTSTAHGLVTGDIIQLFNTTGLMQFAGMAFSVKVLSANTFSVPLDTTGIPLATAGKFRKIAFDAFFQPAVREITKVTTGATTVVRMNILNKFIVGQQVTFRVPPVMGMVELDGLTGKVLSIDTTNNTVEVDIDSRGFSAFAFPATGIGAYTRAQIVAVGEDAKYLQGAFDNTAYIAMKLGSAVVGAAGDLIYWEAVRSDG